MYYIQDSRSFVGNSPLWWGVDGNGYVCDIDKAGLYIKEKAMSLFNSRSTDIPWKQQDVEGAVRKIVDAQHLKKDDSDGFYTELAYLEEKKRIKAKEDYDKHMLKEYQRELSEVLEIVGSDGITSVDVFIHAFDALKGNADLEFHEHYYPQTYHMRAKDIFNDFLKYDLIFQCSCCKNHYVKYYLDEEYDDATCDACGDMRWDKEHEND